MTSPENMQFSKEVMPSILSIYPFLKILQFFRYRLNQTVERRGRLIVRFAAHGKV